MVRMGIDGVDRLEDFRVGGYLFLFRSIWGGRGLRFFFSFRLV